MQSAVCRYFFIRKIKRILKPEMIDYNHRLKVISRPSAQSLDAGSMSASPAAVSFVLGIQFVSLTAAGLLL